MIANQINDLATSTLGEVTDSGPFHRKPTDTRTGSADSGEPSAASTAILIEPRTPRKSISARIVLSSPLRKTG